MEMNLLHVGDGRIGYGRLGVKLNEALEDIGVKCWRHLPTPEEAMTGRMTHLQSGNEGAVCNVIAWIAVPSHARGWWEGQTPVIFTMWESTYLPESFRETLHGFDTVIVPSKQNVELFSRYHDNVKYLPLAVSEEWTFRKRTEPGTFFNFMIGGSGARKGTDLAFKAFHKVFPNGSWGDGPIPRLIMKGPKGESELTGERVEQITGYISPEDEVELYADAHCYLQPSRGEGFGLQPLQAIAQGCPTILTNAHGHESFAHLGYGLDYTLAKSAYFIYGDAGEWWEPDFDQLCERMEYVYNNYDEACALAAKNSVLAHRDFNWRKCAEGFVDIIGRDKLNAPYSGSNKWHWQEAKLYPLITNRDYQCQIAGIERIFTKGVQYMEPADVKRVLFEYNLLDPACCKQDGTEDTGLLPQQVAKLGMYEAKNAFCPTCQQQLNTRLTATDLQLMAMEALDEKYKARS